MVLLDAVFLEDRAFVLSITNGERNWGGDVRQNRFFLFLSRLKEFTGALTDIVGRFCQCPYGSVFGNEQLLLIAFVLAKRHVSSCPCLEQIEAPAG
jgi:hypothetical protein